MNTWGKGIQKEPSFLLSPGGNKTCDEKTCSGKSVSLQKFEPNANLIEVESDTAVLTLFRGMIEVINSRWQIKGLIN